jgi:hypothetical protein
MQPPDFDRNESVTAAARRVPKNAADPGAKPQQALSVLPHVAQPSIGLVIETDLRRSSVCVEQRLRCHASSVGPQPVSECELLCRKNARPAAGIGGPRTSVKESICVHRRRAIKRLHTIVEDRELFSAVDSNQERRRRHCNSQRADSKNHFIGLTLQVRTIKRGYLGCSRSARRNWR